MKKVVSIILVIVWMGLIFSFSSSNGDESSDLSDGIIVNITEKLNKNISKDNLNTIVERFSFIIRKIAHFSIYFVLGCLIMNMFYTFGIKDYYSLIYASLICISYAFMDETHQIFVSGRSGEFRDVMLDSSASLIANYLFYRLFMRIKYEKKVN